MLLACIDVHPWLFVTAGLQAQQETAARAKLEAAKKAGATGVLLSPKELQAAAQDALRPPQEEVRSSS